MKQSLKFQLICMIMEYFSAKLTNERDSENGFLSKIGTYDKIDARCGMYTFNGLPMNVYITQFGL